MTARYAKVSEVADRFRVSADAVYLWIRQGKIPSDCVARIAGTVRVDEEQFERRLAPGALAEAVRSAWARNREATGLHDSGGQLHDGRAWTWRRAPVDQRNRQRQSRAPLQPGNGRWGEMTLTKIASR